MSDISKDLSKDTPKRKAGRPSGSRNKSVLMKAQVLIDEMSVDAVLYLEALMKNDKGFLDIKDDVPPTIRFNATKEILSKGIANEKSKDEVKQPSQSSTTENGEKVHTGPQVFSTAV